MGTQPEPSEAPRRSTPARTRAVALLRRFGPALLLVGVVIFGGRALLSALGVDTSPEALRATLEGFGWWGPAAYVVLLAFRHFLLVPSTLILTLGGGVFGVATNTAAGTIGMAISGLVEFTLFRLFRPEWLGRTMEERTSEVANLADRGAPLVVFLSTAVPPLPMSVFYWAASLTSMRFARFAALVIPSGAIRAFVLSLLGVGLVESDWRLTLGALAAIAAGLGLASLSPRVRAALLSSRSS